MKQQDLFKPLRELQFIKRDLVKPNDYNPNKVLEKNLKLLTESILNNGFCFPIVIRPDYTIIDGFHRWLVSGREPLKTLLAGLIPVVVVSHDTKSDDMAGTITFNRARGTHLLEPMEKIVKKLLDEGLTVDEISKKIGMSKEEIFRLSNIDREQFLKLVTSRKQQFNKGQILRRNA
ncbi:ParB N-terminal domain-containing protein [Parabacteroides sp.]|jgi:ParB-like chromosome segregation protein Spo0J|uniref:ParB N-terminal domain-containing protein n=1 Tax=Parabacteroides sp. TaxID=1869337 RepID=UPI001D5D4577|nr:ParB N-terminal domain-containing protein [Parabacteroides sp.]MBS5485489.1 ParB N-terminal domain-containing protein [Parabacteroides sp.]DAE61668.1 MAG TPA: chromosome partitioning protein [Caudoviricetes sp.]